MIFRAKKPKWVLNIKLNLTKVFATLYRVAVQSGSNSSRVFTPHGNTDIGGKKGSNVVISMAISIRWMGA